MSWWVAQVQPQRERVAVGFLQQFGYETYFPRTLERRMNYGKRVTVERPLFPSYCFVLCQLQWSRACNAPGVIRIINTGFVPATVSDELVESIRQRECNGLVELPKRQHFVPGTAVRILTGPFANQLAIYAGMNGHERVAVLLHVLGAHQRVTLPAADVEPSPPAAG